MSQLSDYEEQRLAKIDENRRMLIALGLESAVASTTKQGAQAKKLTKKPPAEEALTDEQRCVGRSRSRDLWDMALPCSSPCCR